jgi:hypothetical protein
LALATSVLFSVLISEKNKLLVEKETEAAHENRASEHRTTSSQVGGLVKHPN